MRTLAFDGRMGASGDMLLGALLAAGADRSALAPVEEGLDLQYEVETVTEQGLSATSVDVVLSKPDPGGSETEHDHTHEDTGIHPPDHSHEGTATHGSDHIHDKIDAEGHGPPRRYREVRDIVASLDLPPGVESDAGKIFEILGEAEAAVHGHDLEETHFHEVGADDAIADVVGVCLLVADLDPDQVVTTPVSAGAGEVEMSHGTYPVPAPAVLEIAENADWVLKGGPDETELFTPTGAAILAHFADGVDSLPALTLDASGYGVGGYRASDRPNVLRALVGDSSAGLTRESITVLETNLDDASPELLGGLQETLSEVGALDVSVLPVTMKKSRPGHLVKVITKPENARRVARRLAEETGTLGIREHGAGHRWIADREKQSVTLAFDDTEHVVTVKIAASDDEVYDVSAEYDDALAVASETGLPIREVMRRAERAVGE